jgi:hypothetical protein
VINHASSSSFFFLNVDLSCFFFNSAAAAQGVVFVEQAGHKPSHNALDQAFWHCLACAVRKRSPEFKERVGKADLLDKLFKVVEEEFWGIDPEIIDDCFRSVRAAAQETIEGKGWTTGKQQHRGEEEET